MSPDRDFVVEIDGSGPNEYRIRVRSSAGESAKVVEFDPVTLVGDLTSVQDSVIRSSSTGLGSRDLSRLNEIGAGLFEAIFSGDAAALFMASRNEAERRAETLCVVLRLPAELAFLPWELLFDRRSGEYICRRSPLVRYPEVPEPVQPLAGEPPLRVLGMTATPHDLSPLDVDAEKRGLADALAPLERQGLVTLEWAAGESWHDAQDALLAGCHVFHFIGHGAFDVDEQQGLIFFTGKQGTSQRVRATALAELLSVARPGPRLAVLSSCQTATGVATETFSSAGAILVRRVPAVVAMQFAISEDAATVFSHAFYQAIAHDLGVDDAVRAGRIALTGWRADTMEWVTPVLYMRSREARLFVLSNLPAATPADVGAGRPSGKVAPGREVPAQLPASPVPFTGRTWQLQELDDLVSDHVQGASAAVISVIAGMAGVGKTSLAVHWAHRVADRFPDGQLYVNLRGFDPNKSVMSPAEALRGFLDAFHVPPKRIPANVQAQADLYRSLLAGKQVLVVLDNARDAEQVRPLLPGAPGCVVVVTSRSQLTGLVVTEGAHLLLLDILPTAEAREFLGSRLGWKRLAAEPRAVEEIIARCARLPLALAIAAARAAVHPGFPLGALADELRAARGSLDAFDGGDSVIDVRAVFSWSYHALSRRAAWQFRVLGLHPGPDLAAPAAASLSGMSSERARGLLSDLVRAHLITEHAPGRYTLHDLLRAYAAERAAAEPEGESRAALHRVLDHYVHTAHAAAMLLVPSMKPIPLSPPQPGVTAIALASREAAVAWFTTEHAVLLAVLDRAASSGFDAHVWQLAWALAEFFDRQGHWHDRAATNDAALAAARRLDDVSGQAFAHGGIGRAYVRIGRNEDAQVHLRRALDLYGQLGDQVGQEDTHRALSWMFGQQGRHLEELEHAQLALDLSRAIGDPTKQARALNYVGWAHAMLGDYHAALVYCQQGLDLQVEGSEHYSQAETWNSLGYAHHRLGHHEQAVVCYERALAVYRKQMDIYNEAQTLIGLGDTYRSAGDAESARTVWELARDILDQLGHPDAGDIRIRLHSLGPDVETGEADGSAHRAGADGTR